MNKKLYVLVTAIITLILIPIVAFAAAPFYEGKTVRIIVGMSPGGGFDTYSRIIARHMGKHIAGNPKIIVENMPGAGSIIAANHIYKVAKPDGLTIGHFNGGLLFDKILGREGAEFDPIKFEYIGSYNMAEVVCALSKASGISSIDQWVSSKKQLKFGGVGVGNLAPDNTPKILKAALGLPIQLVSGYKGTAEVRLAVEGGEVEGCCFGWEQMQSLWHDALEKGDVIAIIQVRPQPLPEIPNVPLAINLAKSDDARQIIEKGIHSNLIFNRPLLLPPGTPKERLEILRNALQATLKDKELLVETKKAQLGLNPVTGEELEKAVAGLYKVDPALLTKIKKILFE